MTPRIAYAGRPINRGQPREVLMTKRHARQVIKQWWAKVDAEAATQVKP